MIQLNVSQKLSRAALGYLLLRSGFLAAVVILVAYLIVVSAQYPTFKLQIVTAAILLSLLSSVYIWLWWKLFEYTVAENHIQIRSGVIFRSEKNVNFNDIQSANAVFGPLLAVLGLRQVRGFTSSPEQIVITTTKTGSRTQHIPDIQIILDKQTAEDLLEVIRKGDVHKVQAVSQTL